jgi:hypothetical protein
MDPDRIVENAERDQLWASLRALKPVIDRMAEGVFDPADRLPEMVQLLARVVRLELEFRARDAGE